MRGARKPCPRASAAHDAIAGARGGVDTQRVIVDRLLAAVVEARGRASAGGVEAQARDHERRTLDAHRQTLTAFDHDTPSSKTR